MFTTAFCRLYLDAPRLASVTKRTAVGFLIRCWGFVRSVVLYLNPWVLRSWRRFYSELLVPGDMAIDVGAHVGTRARAMHAVGTRVIALEPQRPFSTFLRRTVSRSIVVIEAAAGRSESHAQMAVSSRHPTVSSLHDAFVSWAPTATGFEKVRWDRSQKVSVTTLDAVIAHYGTPRYIKIDVEGFEIEVLAGVSTAVELVSVEFLPAMPHLSRAVIDRLTEMGEYRFNPVVGEKGRFLWEQWQDSATTKKWLAGLPLSGQSGDLFARLTTN